MQHIKNLHFGIIHEANLMANFIIITFQPPFLSTSSILLTAVDTTVTLMQVVVANEHIFVL